jgi:hypothetical protein
MQGDEQGIGALLGCGWRVPAAMAVDRVKWQDLSQYDD